MVDDVIADALTAQSQICDKLGSPFYARLLRCAAGDLEPARRLLAPWRHLSFEGLMDAGLPVRLLGALHELVLSGEVPALAAAFPPRSDAGAAWVAASSAMKTHLARLTVFMAHEPQTNEVRRSVCLLPGFLTIAAETGLPLRCLEAGASAGLNQLWPRYHYDLGSAGAWGDPASLVHLSTDWSGPPPPLASQVLLDETRACDHKPIDIKDPTQRARLRAYIWADQLERLARFNEAATLAIAAGVKVEAADAAEWAAANAAPKRGVATVFFHSIVWQYLPAASQTRLRDALLRHGAAASQEAPLAWLRMEPVQGQMLPIELRLTLWPSGEDRRLAIVNGHGSSVAWGAPDSAAAFSTLEQFLR